MNTKTKVITAVVISTTILLLTVSIVSAATYQLSGRVTDQFGNPLAGSEVELLTPGTSVIVTSTTTNTNGYYAVFVQEVYVWQMVSRTRISLHNCFSPKAPSAIMSA